jgi:hypothetical protein
MSLRILFSSFLLLSLASTASALWIPIDVHRLVDDGAVYRARPDLAVSGEHYLVAWSAWRAQGEPGDTHWQAFGVTNRRIELRSAGSFPCRGALAAAAGEDRFAVVCTDSTFRAEEVFVQFVSLTGDPLGQPVRLPFRGFNPAIEWDGSAFTIVWSNLITAHLDLARVSPGGTLLEVVHELVDPHEIPPGYRSEQIRPTLIAVDGKLLLLWQEGNIRFTCYFTCPPPLRPGILRARYLLGSELLAEPELLIEDPVAAVLPDATRIGEEIAIVWFAQRRAEEYAADLHLARVTEDLETVTHTRLENEGRAEYYGVLPSIDQFDGVIHVGWEVVRPQPPPYWRTTRELRVASGDWGTLVIEPDFIVASSASQSHPRLISLDRSTILLAYAEDPGDETRVVLNVYSEGEASRRRAVRRR